jgi:catecholate siderophore receptor
LCVLIENDFHLQQFAQGEFIMQFLSILVRMAAAFALLSIFLTAAFADDIAVKGTLRGTVSDQNRAVIAGAKIEVIRTGGRERITAVSNSQGEFILSVEPGDYELRVTAGRILGFKEHIVVKAGENSVADVELGVAESTATVTIMSSGEYMTDSTSSATKTLTSLRDIPQSISSVGRQQLNDQMLTSIGDVVRYQPGITAHQGENNRDQVIIRGQSSSADFFINGVRDDVQYYRDLYNLERVEAIRGPNALIFGRGGGGGVINRVTKEAGFLAFARIQSSGRLVRRLCVQPQTSTSRSTKSLHFG